MLAFLSQHRVDYVIVHKVDRLARNRQDDIEITVAIRTAGCKLVSCTENIDETPSGLLLHGIMSSIAEFYSRNLANEVAKGLLQKAKAGGTPGKAPLGYLNIRRFENGRELRTVEVDRVRGPLVTWAFEQYATGEWRLKQLCEELGRRGLDVPATRSKPATKLHISRLHAVLTHPYYKGVVAYLGVDYQGRHQPLVSAQTWERVQEVLATHNHAREKERRHNHYLKGSLYCGHCDSRMIITHSLSGTGKRYSYFTCIGKHQKRTGCTMRATSITTLEDLVEDHYSTIQLPAELCEVIERTLREELQAHCQEARSHQHRLTNRKKQLLDERTKLLEAHYAGAVPLDQLRSEQQRIAREVDNIESQTDAANDHESLIETNLKRALDLVADCQQAYISAPPQIRRRFNQIFFEKLYVEEGTIRSDLAAPFKTLLSSELHSYVKAKIEPGESAAASNGSGARTRIAHTAQQALRALEALSVKELKMVAGAGFEPATSGL